jgi:hypothetical protein
MLGLLAVTTIGIGAAAVSAGARAHGEYDWIRQGGYQSIRGGPCCGVDDCYKIKPEDISVQGGKYRVKSWGAEFPVEHTLPSEDRHFWMCLDEMDVRCFFAPGGDV